MMKSDVERGCLIPAAQAFVTGLVTALIVLALAMINNWASPGWLAMLGGAAGAVLIWVASLLTWRATVINESLEFIPLQRQPEASPASDHIRIEFVEAHPGGRRTQIVDLPASPGNIQKIARGVLSGTPFSESAWTGAGRPFSRAQFHQIRGEFLSRGWVVWRNEDAPSQGVMLTSQGEAVMRYLASPSPTLVTDRTHEGEQGVRARAYAQETELP